MFDIFKKVSSLDKEQKNEGPQEIINSPLEGNLVSLADVPDPVFSSKMMGDGFAIIPTKGIVVSPVDGIVRHIAETKHAIGIETTKGNTIIIHFGLDTVNLKGKGFKILIEPEQKVKQSDKLLIADLNIIKENAYSVITPIVFPNLTKDKKLLITQYNEHVTLGQKNIATIIYI